MIIASEEELAPAVALMAQCSRLAVDTETNGLHAYRSRVCLIQVSDGDRVWIIDTLPFPPSDARTPGTAFAGLFDVFENPAILKILHGASHDIASLKEDYGRGIRNIFDTYVAAQMLNYEKIGLSSLVEKHCEGLVLSKVLQKANWGKRPLDADAFNYLRHDVLHLIPVYEAVLGELQTADLLEEAQLESRREEEIVALQPAFDPDGFWRIKGSETLDDVGLAFLKRLYAIRDRLARDLDRPAFKVIPDPLLVSMAGKKSQGDLRQESFLYRRHVKPLLAPILEAFKLSRTEARPTRSPRPQPVRQFDNAPPRNVRERYETALKDWRRAEALARGVATIAVLPNHLLELLVFSPPRQVSDLAAISYLGSRRIQRYGPKLVELAAAAASA